VRDAGRRKKGFVRAAVDAKGVVAFGGEVGCLAWS